MLPESLIIQISILLDFFGGSGVVKRVAVQQSRYIFTHSITLQCGQLMQY